MNRKYNPYVSLVALLLAAVILVLTCTGCVVRASWGNTEDGTTARFTVEYAGAEIRIITDNETGVQYLAYVHANGAGLTELLPGEG
jgi:hypothetical protein